MADHVVVNLRAITRFAPALVGMLVLALYLLTMPRGLTWDLGGADGGELATAVYTRGLVHSPGYPTYLLLAQPATLIPVESPAHRLNIFSALCAAGAIALLGWGTGSLLADSDAPSWSAPLAGGITAFLLGLCELVWTQAIITEVYALAALFCAGLLLLTLHAERAPTPVKFSQRLALVGLVAGSGIGSHYMVALMILFAAIYLALSVPRMLFRPGSLIALLTFAAGLSVFAYLPLRAGAVPISNWGDPDTLERFIRVVRGAAYVDRFRPALVLTRFAPLIGVVVRQFSLPGIALAILGLSGWWDTRRPLLIATLITTTLNLLIAASYDSADILPYLYPALILLALAAGSAAHTALFTWLRVARRWQMLAYAGLAILVCVPLLVRGFKTAGQATTRADEFARQVAAEAPPGSLILSDQDARTFAIRYAVAVSPGRSDVVPVDVRLLQYEWYRSDLARFYPQLGLDAAAVADPSFDVSDLLAHIPPDMPVAFVSPE